MALTGKEHVNVTGVINGGLAAKQISVTTQQIANLRTGAPSALTGNEPVSVRGPSASGPISPVPFNTTAHLIGAIGSIAPSTLLGTEIVLIGPPETGSAPAAIYEQTTTLAIANS